MNPITITLLSLGIAIPLVTVNIVLPTFNMHMRLNRQEILRQSVLNVVNQNRHQPYVLQTLLVKDGAAIPKIQGINIQSITKQSQGQYDLYTITYREDNLFFNQFFKPEQIVNQNQSMQILVDRVI